MVVAPQLLQFVLTSCHVVLSQTLQVLLLDLHRLVDISCRNKENSSISYSFMITSVKC